MSSRPRRVRLLSGFAGLFLSIVAVGIPSSGNGPDKDFRKTAFVTCWDKDWKNLVTREARSPWLHSPNGELSAHVRVDARAIPGEGMGDCANTSQILVKKVGSEERKVHELTPPSDGPKGNGVVLVDWSADSRFLLLDLLTWYYFSEGWDHTVLLYDTKEGAVSSFPLNEIFSPLRGEPCVVEAQVIGFSKEGNVVIDIAPMGDDELWLSCVDERGRWLLNPNSKKVDRAAAKLKVKRIGRKGARGGPKSPQR